MELKATQEKDKQLKVVLDSLDEGILMTKEQDIVFQNKLLNKMIEDHHEGPIKHEHEYLDLKIFSFYEGMEKSTSTVNLSRHDKMSLRDIQKFSCEELTNSLFST